MTANQNNLALTNLSRESLTQAVLLLMNEKPYSELTVTDICNRAGVSRNAFYRNYPAKDAILRRYLFEITNEYRCRLRKTNPLTNKQLFVALFSHLGTTKSLTKNLLASGLDYLITDVFFKSFIDLANSERFPVYSRCHLAGSIVSIYIHWVANDQPETPEEMASLVCELHRLDENALLYLPPVSDIETLMSNFTYNK